jgi:uncharacterized protein with GYD domain
VQFGKEDAWLVFVGHDLVSVAEFPDDETGTAFLLALGSQGSIRTTTLRAFNEQEFQTVLDKTP